MQNRMYLLKIVSFILTLGELKWFKRLVHKTTGRLYLQPSHNLHSLKGRWVLHSLQYTSSIFSPFPSHGFHLIYVCLSWWPSIRSSTFHLYILRCPLSFHFSSLKGPLYNSSFTITHYYCGTKPCAPWHY